MNKYDHYPGDYARDTRDLNLTQHGAYRMLLDAYYSTERPIPDAAKFRVVGAFTEQEQNETQWVLNRFFELRDGHWHHERADREIEKAQPRIRAARENGRRGGRPKKTQLVSEQEPTGEPAGYPSRKPNKEPTQNPHGGGGGNRSKEEMEGGNDPRSQEVSCPFDLKLTDEQVKVLEVEMIPSWAVEAITRERVGSWAGDPSDTKPLGSWRKYLLGAVRSIWKDPNRRPKKPDAKTDPQEAAKVVAARKAAQQKADEAHRARLAAKGSAKPESTKELLRRFG